MAGAKKRKLVATAGAATILLCCQGAAAWISVTSSRTRVPAAASALRPLHSQRHGDHGDGGGPSRAPLEPPYSPPSTPSSSLSPSSNTKAPLEPPSSSPSSPSSSSSLLEALPTTDPSLYRGRWIITGSNELLAEDMTGFVALEIDTSASINDPGATFKAVGQTKQGPPFLSSQVTRNGSFTLLVDPEQDSEASVAAGAEKEGGGARGQQQEVVGEILFHSDEIQPQLGLPLPAPLTPSHVRDLGGKRRRVHVRVEGVNTITLFFPESRTFFILERASPTAQQEAASAAGGGVPPLAVLVTTNIVSLLASGIAEGLKHEAATLFDAIMRR